MPLKNLKTEYIGSRCTKDEKRIVQQKAKAAGFRGKRGKADLSEFIMWVIMNHEPIRIHAFNEQPKQT